MTKPSFFKVAAIGGTAAWLAVFALLPFLLILVVSFLARDPSSFVSPSFSLEGYATIADGAFLRIFLDSLAWAATTAAACLLLGYPFAYGLARLRTKRKNLFLLLIIIPFWTNSLIRTYALIFILKAQGLLNTLLLGLGLVDHPLEILYTDTAVLVGLIYTLLPFMILPLYSSIEKLDPRLLEAAKDLGAGRFRAFFAVSLPLTWPGILAGTMLTFLPALGMFYVADVLGGAKSLLIGNFIKNQFLTARDWPTGSAASVVLTGIMILLLLLYGGSGKGAPRKPEDIGA